YYFIFSFFLCFFSFFLPIFYFFFFFFFNDTATTEIYTLSLHDALPVSCARSPTSHQNAPMRGQRTGCYANNAKGERITNGGSSGVAATSEVFQVSIKRPEGTEV